MICKRSETELKRCCLPCCLVVGVQPAGGVQLHFGRGAQETVLKSCKWKGVPAKAFAWLVAKQCPYSPCFVPATAATAGQQRNKYCLFARTYTLYIAPGRVAIVTMASNQPR